MDGVAVVAVVAVVQVAVVQVAVVQVAVVQVTAAVVQQVAAAVVVVQLVVAAAVVVVEDLRLAQQFAFQTVDRRVVAPHHVHCASKIPIRVWERTYKLTRYVS